MPEMAALAAGCPHVVVDDEGTAYCALAESQGEEVAVLSRLVARLWERQRPGWTGDSWEWPGLAPPDVPEDEARALLRVLKC